MAYFHLSKICAELKAGMGSMIGPSLLGLYRFRVTLSEPINDDNIIDAGRTGWVICRYPWKGLVLRWGHLKLSCPQALCFWHRLTAFLTCDSWESCKSWEGTLPSQWPLHLLLRDWTFSPSSGRPHVVDLCSLAFWISCSVQQQTDRLMLLPSPFP